MTVADSESELALANDSSGISDADAGYEFWGKSKGLDTPYPLICHLLDTAAAAESIVNEMLPDGLKDAISRQMCVDLDVWLKTVRVLAGWHDVGKASRYFQMRDKYARPKWAHSSRRLPCILHAEAGAYYVWDKLEPLDKKIRLQAAQIIGGHHGHIPRLSIHELKKQGEQGGAKLVDSDPPSELEDGRQWIWGVLDSIVGDLPAVEMPLPAASMTLAVVVLADWIASTHDLIKKQTETLASGFDPQNHYCAALELASRHLDETGLTAPSPWRKAKPSRLINDDVPKWTGLQASISESFKPNGPGIVVICAPTGEGKTEAALICAERFAKASKRHGLFFAMPTVATSEGLYDRLNSCINKLNPNPTALRRAHSQSMLAASDSSATVSDDETSTATAAMWMRGSRKSLLAPFGVGTVDQLLLGAMQSRHSPLRLLGAATGVVVVDEAHSFDPYMRKLLCRAVEWLAALGAPVVVLSATMPSSRACELFEAYQKGLPAQAELSESNNAPSKFRGYPAWIAWTESDGWTEADSEPRRSWKLRFDVEETPQHNLDSTLAQAAVKEFDAGANVLVVRNTVGSAQQTYRQLLDLDKRLVHGETIEIIHSRMQHKIRADRSKKLAETFGSDRSERPRHSILVATQVVEQSFDVDFDVLVTESAPLAALLQRSGRVRRHLPLADNDTVRATVVWPTERNNEPSTSSPIYTKADLMRTYSSLAERRKEGAVNIDVPGEVPDLIDGVDAEREASQFEFMCFDDEEFAETTLAQLTQDNARRSKANKWLIPPPSRNDPLYELTDEMSPRVRDGSPSELLIPCTVSDDKVYYLVDGACRTIIEPNCSIMPSNDTINRVYNAAIPVSYPPAVWREKLDTLRGGWCRTPVAGALLVALSNGECRIDDWQMSLQDEFGLVITKETK